jgi:hypothetical protein
MSQRCAHWVEPLDVAQVTNRTRGQHVSSMAAARRRHACFPRVVVLKSNGDAHRGEDHPD